MIEYEVAVVVPATILAAEDRDIKVYIYTVHVDRARNKETKDRNLM